MPSLDGLSRLKGIETYYHVSLVAEITSCLDGLSRLKGIETKSSPGSVFRVQSFGWTFPLEGN